MGARRGLIVTAFNYLAYKETTVVEETNTEGDCPTCPKNAKNGDIYTENSFSILDKNTWSNFSKAKTYTYFGGEWSEIKYITGDVPLGPGGVFKGAGLLKKMPSLDATGKVHGALPRVKDFVNFSKGELKILLNELKQSVPKRIKSTTLKGPNASKLQNRQHGQRQGAEQDLIKSLEKFLRK
ncbi:hypothetical protein BBI01_11655 [Chryseobacterium artocarpi]|uniref:Uncharacterized protein n=1 Tax=Chryseobacterium artocarpi TaxID=1414727 RepID=A0A1B8ZG61_9FLAO|nr:hypothetical protein [Chryseobacterium artocarpi]OCA70600.1 hypothetical protein BBI01_11655 [Chryseobacterium artocarpi]